MKNGFLGPAVATVPTVYGIETGFDVFKIFDFKLQQYLPFTVLKREMVKIVFKMVLSVVATVPTVYGIETEDGSEVESDV